MTDSLTGLGNQRAWWDRIAEEDARIERSEASAVVALIDLDDLKTINDERGHLHGDLLLRLAAQTLREAVRTCDHIARVGGDEFAVLAVDFDGEPAVLHERLTTAFDRAERIQNLRHAFRLRQNADVRELGVLLIDDVLTTGSTLSECARILKKGGAISVHAATAARA